MSEHSGSCTDREMCEWSWFAESGWEPCGFQTGRCHRGRLFSVHTSSCCLAAGAGLPIFLWGPASGLLQSRFHAPGGSVSDGRAVWRLRTTPVWGGRLWEARSTALSQGSFQLGSGWSGWPSFLQETLLLSAVLPAFASRAGLAPQ